MIEESTKVNIVDNSGAIEGKCIKIILPKSFYGRRTGKVGDIIVLSVTKTIAGSKIKKGDIMKGLIVRTKKGSNKLRPIKKSVKLETDHRGVETTSRPWGSVANGPSQVQTKAYIVTGKRSNNNGYTLTYSDNSVVLIKTGKKA